MEVFLLPDKEYTQQCVLHTGDTLHSTVFQLEALIFISEIGFLISSGIHLKNRDYSDES